MNGTDSLRWNRAASFAKQLCCAVKSNAAGQALVEFTLIFILLLVVAWIPADFGLAFFTGQIAQNASREGARLAAANRTNPAGTTSCVLPCTAASGILRATADRMSSALLPGGVVSLTVDAGAACDRMVTVQVSGQYNFFFYQLLRLMGFSAPDQTAITRSTSMRWEHQC
jgi:Flp pilus assembly protein TadG